MRNSLTSGWSGWRAWKQLSLGEWNVAILILVVLLVIGVLLWQAWQAQAKLLESAALDEAARYSETLADFRTLYTSEVAARVGSHGVEVTHDYASKEGAIPLPATLSMMIGERIAERETGGYVRLFSDFPFPWRIDGGPKDDFELEALTRLRQNPSEPYYGFDQLAGRPVLRYATADVMRESCVDCHNTHPDSPKTNWKAGDLRGVLEVTVPLDAARAQAIGSFRGTFILLMTIGSIALGTLIVTGRNLRKKLRAALEKAEQFGQYTLEDKLGEGGMGEVHRARHALLRRPTAVKILRRQLVSNESVVRFEREVQLTSQLTHPNTIAIYDYGHTPEGDFYYAMEYVDGLSLKTFVQRFGPLPEARTIYILRQVCASLEEAHAAGLVHRDIKPANIMICRRGDEYDVVKVLDFGLVKHVGGKREDDDVTDTHSVTGSPLYMSPEQVSAPKEVDARSDLYQVGAVGYFVLTGEPIFTGDNVVHALANLLSMDPEPPSGRMGRPVARDTEELIMQCLAKRKEDRPISARILMGALESCDDATGWDRHKARDWWLSNARDMFGNRAS